MVKAYLNVRMKAVSGEGLAIVEANISLEPGWCLGAKESDCFWAVVYESEAPTFAEAQTAIEFLLDRGDMWQFAGFVLLKKAVEKDLCRPIGNGTIAELLPPGVIRIPCVPPLPPLQK